MRTNPIKTIERHVPPGRARNEVLRLVDIGARFQRNHTGRPTGALMKVISACVSRVDRLTFNDLLYELELEAAKRSLRGESASPIHRVDRLFEIVVYHSKTGRKEVAFSTVRNILTKAKKK